MTGTIAHPDASANRSQRRHPNDPAFLDREEAAQSLRVSVSTLDRQIKAGKLRAARIGRRVVISPQAIDAFRRDVEVAEWGEAL
jgi:excisionase family DNA binding protein